MNKFLNLIQKKDNIIPPIWIMRQAGRYLPEYRQVRSTVNNFLELCYNSEKAAEVTLQPIKRFDFDAAIIFSDILVLPHALGYDVKFEEGIGPVLHQFTSKEDFKFLNNDPSTKLNNVYEAIKIVKKGLNNDKALIGFVGSPWTVVSYMLEGRGKQNSFEASKKFLYENYTLALELIELITYHTIKHLKLQITAGANVIKLFDSWSGVLTGTEYNDFVINPTNKIVRNIKQHFPNIPIIGLPKGSGFLYKEYIEKTEVDILACDQFVPAIQMRKWQNNNIIVQGNLDPLVLLTNKKIIKTKIDELFKIINKQNYIFNLGHGILPNTPVENVEFLINYVRNQV